PVRRGNIREHGAVLEAVRVPADEACLHVDGQAGKALEALAIEGGDRLMAAEDPVRRDHLGIAGEVRHELVEVACTLVGPVRPDARLRRREGRICFVLAGRLMISPDPGHCRHTSCLWLPTAPSTP